MYCPDCPPNNPITMVLVSHNFSWLGGTKDKPSDKANRYLEKYQCLDCGAVIQTSIPILHISGAKVNGK